MLRNQSHKSESKLFQLSIYRPSGLEEIKEWVRETTGKLKIVGVSIYANTKAAQVVEFENPNRNWLNTKFSHPLRPLQKNRKEKEKENKARE